MNELHAYYRCVLAALKQQKTPPAPPPGLLARLEGLSRLPDAAARSRLAPGQLRIAIVSREYPPETAFGGIATWAYQLARGLAEAGHRVTVIARGMPFYERDANGIEVTRIQPGLGGPPFERQLGAELPYHEALFGFGLAALVQLRRLEERQGAPFDVVDLADHAGEGLVPALFSERPSIVRLYTPCAMLHDMRASLTTRVEDDALFLLENALLRSADGVVGISRDLAARTRTYFGLEAPIPFVPNPIDTDLFRPAEPTTPPSSDRNLRVVFVGRLENRKGVRTLFEALPRVLAEAPRLELQLTGADSEGLRASFLEQRRWPRVHFQDPVPLVELPRVYQAADIAVVPSYYDNSPYTCIEPMACGLAVVGTSAGGMPEYLEHGVSGRIVPSRDAAALADAILGLARDPAERRRMGACARRRALRDFDYRAVTGTMVEHYREAIARRRAVGTPGLRGRAGPDPRVPLRYAPALPLSATRGEALVVAREGEDRPLDRSMAAIRACAELSGPTAVIREDGAPRFPTHEEQAFVCDPGEATAPVRLTARIVSTALGDFVIPLRAGEELDPVAVRLIAWLMAADARVGVVTLPATSGPSGLRRRMAFASAALRGPILDRGDETSWPAIGQHLYDATRDAGWLEVALPIPLLRGEAAIDGSEVEPRTTPAALAPPATPRPVPIDRAPRPRWLPPPVATRVTRLQLSWLGAWPLLAACAARVLGPIERAQRVLARDPSLTGRHARPLIVAGDTASGLACWRRLQARGEATGGNGTLVTVGPASAGPVVEPGLEIHPLGGILPEGRHAEAIARLLARHARVALHWVGELENGPLAAAVRAYPRTPARPRPPESGPPLRELPTRGGGTVGIDSDGWAGLHARTYVDRPPGYPRLAIRGMIPLIDDPGFRCSVTIAVDGVERVERRLGPGSFAFAFALPLEPATVRVDLRSDRTQTLPAPDGRAVVARLSHLGCLPPHAA